MTNEQKANGDLSKLASDIAMKLEAAGLPVHLESNETSAGVYIEIDETDDSGSGVYLKWNTSSILANEAINAAFNNEIENADLQYFDLVSRAMEDAIGKILTSTGFRCVSCEDLRVGFIQVLRERK